MLMSIIYSILIMMSTMYFKNSWKTMCMLSTTIMAMLMMKYPLSDSLYTLSKSLMLDSLSLTMLFLCFWVTPLMAMASNKMKPDKNNNMFMTTIIMLLINLIICFTASNTLMFYITFEASLIPIFMLIMLWGYQPERKMASLYIIMYTITASLPLLMIILKLLSMNYHLHMFMMNFLMPYNMNTGLSWVMLMAAFMVKLPLFSLHLWLPKAHVEAPVAGSMVLAAILLKLGGYGLMRMNKMVYQSLSYPSYMIISVSALGALITNAMCLRQTDLKALIAYSSVSHMSMLIISTLSNSKLGQCTSLIIMLTHGLTSSCMFFLTNILYEKIKSRNILLTGGMLMYNPSNSLMWMMVMITNMALPPSLNTLGEIMSMAASLLISKFMMMMIMMVSFTSTVYSLYMYSMINHGNQPNTVNPNTNMLSTNSLTSTMHILPLFILTTMPLKLSTWS